MLRLKAGRFIKPFYSNEQGVGIVDADGLGFGLLRNFNFKIHVTC